MNVDDNKYLSTYLTPNETDSRTSLKKQLKRL